MKMHHHYADDGRIMTPPSELEPLLKDAFPEFSKLLGHMRKFYMLDEIWDGQATLVFNANGESLADVTLADGAFRVHIADMDFTVHNESQLDTIFEALKTAAPDNAHRSMEQLIMQTSDPSKFHCGYRCDLCEAHKEQNQFVYYNWLCYRDCVPGIDILNARLQKTLMGGIVRGVPKARGGANANMPNVLQKKDAPIVSNAATITIARFSTMVTTPRRAVWE